MITFLIIAVVIFLVIKAINKAQEIAFGEKKEESELAPEPSAEEELLAEIRDLLKAQSQQV